jgi:post-segregation antitoxin (ccd killing protein)
VAEEKQRRAADAELVRATVATWNRFADEHGSFADEHSTL